MKLVISAVFSGLLRSLHLLATWLVTYWLPLVAGIMLMTPVHLVTSLAGVLIVTHIVFREEERQRLKLWQIERPAMRADEYDRMINILRNANHEELAQKLLDARAEWHNIP